MGKKLGIVLFFLLLAIAGGLWIFNCNEIDQPNVIIMVTNNQGYGDAGFNGNQIIETPTLDSMASSSVVFNRFYVSPNGLSTHTSILTGNDYLYPKSRTDVASMNTADLNALTLANIFKKNRYCTSYFGKWLNGSQFTRNPNELGFDQFIGGYGNQADKYFVEPLENTANILPLNNYSANCLTDSVIEFIGHEKKPFLAFITFNLENGSHEIDEKYFNNYIEKGLDNNTAKVYSEYQNIDDNVSRIIQQLKKNGLWHNTILVFTSDNGPDFIRYNGNLKGRMGQVDEGGLRVPFFIHYPDGKFKNRFINEGFAAHIDILPTLLELCGIQYDSNVFDGISFANVLKDEKLSPTDRYFFSYQSISGDIILSGAIRNSMLAVIFNAKDTALYNLEVDPYQGNNIYKEYPEITEQFIYEYNRWLNRFSIDKNENALAASNVLDNK